MFKILYISHLHPPHDAHLENMGGMQRVSMQLVNEFESMPDIELKSITLHAKWKNVGVKTAGFLAKLVRSLPSIVRDFKPDIILFSSMVTASLAPLLKKRISVPMITINHGQDVTMPVRMYQSYLPRVFASLSGVISVSDATRIESITRGLDQSKAIALPNGYQREWEEHMIERSQAKSFLQQTFSIPEKNTILLTVGRLVKRKGHAWFTEEVLPHLSKNITWLIIGDGGEYPEIEKAIHRHQLEDSIVFAGRQSDQVLYNAYSGADLFIMPNIPVPGDMEGFGIVMLEAGLAGTPSIASDLEGIKDVIVDGRNGYKISPLDSKAYINKIVEVLASDLSELRESTKKYIKEHFSWETVALRYVSFLKEVHNKHKLGSIESNLIQKDY